DHLGDDQIMRGQHRQPLPAPSEREMGPRSQCPFRCANPPAIAIIEARVFGARIAGRRFPDPGRGDHLPAGPGARVQKDEPETAKVMRRYRKSMRRMVRTWFEHGPAARGREIGHADWTSNPGCEAFVKVFAGKRLVDDTQRVEVPIVVIPMLT